QGDHEKALESYFECYDIAKKRYPKSQGGAASGIGLIFRVIENNEKSKEYFQEAYQLGKVYKDTAGILQSLNNLGIIAKNENHIELSFQYYNEGLALAIANKSLRREGEIYYNLSVLYDMTGETEKSFEFMEKSAAVTQKIGNKRGAALDYYSLGSYYIDDHQYGKAIDRLELALDYGLESGYMELVIEVYNALGIAYYGNKEFEEAYACSTRSAAYKDSLNTGTTNSQALQLENDQLLAEIGVQDSLDKIQRQNQRDYEQKLSDEKVKSRDLLLWASAVVILLIIGAFYLVFRSRTQLKAKNKTITHRNNQILLQKDEIEEQHNEIRDSINYAKRIQTALLSGNDEWDKIATNHYVLFKPKDVVSGDFYWAHHFEKEEISVWVTADCTGHGVPGAFMSMLGIGFLNEIVIENGIKDGPQILKSLREKIIKALDQKGASHQQKDGMDLALCIWDKKTNKLQYTGANNPLWILRNRENITEGHFDKVMIHEPFTYGLIEIAANKMPVGFYTEDLSEFISQEVQLLLGDRIISFTDGYADQFGGDKGKKMKYRPFKKIIIEAQPKPFKLHGDILTRHFDEWIGEFEQIDDVCIIGISVD
ncbi:MAG: serine phosphatase RsbU (regulator of sigma subunit), partial [Arenicella sp.]